MLCTGGGLAGWEGGRTAFQVGKGEGTKAWRCKWLAPGEQPLWVGLLSCRGAKEMGLKGEQKRPRAEESCGRWDPIPLRQKPW